MDEASEKEIRVIDNLRQRNMLLRNAIKKTIEEAATAPEVRDYLTIVIEDERRLSDGR